MLLRLSNAFTAFMGSTSDSVTLPHQTPRDRGQIPIMTRDLRVNFSQSTTCTHTLHLTQADSGPTLPRKVQYGPHKALCPLCHETFGPDEWERKGRLHRSYPSFKLWAKNGRVTVGVAAGSIVPWHEWELDKAFFLALTRYTVNHPEATLPRVLDKVTRGLEANQDLFLLIPNVPFPARDLIQALAHLVKLGVVCY